MSIQKQKHDKMNLMPDTILVNVIDDDSGWSVMSKNDINLSALQDLVKDEKEIEGTSNLPSNSRNSCYIDSVLVALFLENNVLVTSMFLSNVLPLSNKPSQFVYGRTSKEDFKMRRQIQQTLIKFVKQIRQGRGDADGVTNLRGLLGQCRFGSNFDAGAQEDASDFLAVLCQIFNVHDNQNEQKMQVMGSIDLIHTPPKTVMLTTDVTNSMGLVHHVFEWTPGCLINDTICHKLDSVVEEFSEHKFVRAITVTEFKPTLFFVVHIDRTASGKLNRSPIFVETSLNTNGRKFKLMSIVLHMGNIGAGHYICLILRERKLFMFDDMRQTLTLSTFTAEQIARHCVLVFYSV